MVFSNAASLMLSNVNPVICKMDYTEWVAAEPLGTTGYQFFFAHPRLAGCKVFRRFL